MTKNGKKELMPSYLVAGSSTKQEWILGSLFFIFSIGIGMLGIGIDALDYGSKYGYFKGYHFFGPDYRSLLVIIIFFHCAYFLFRLWSQKNNKNIPIAITLDMVFMSFVCLSVQVALVFKMNIVFL